MVAIEGGLSRDLVDHASERAFPVQHRCRPLDDLDALEMPGVGVPLHHGRGGNAHAILQDRHGVAREAAHHERRGIARHVAGHRARDVGEHLFRSAQATRLHLILRDGLDSGRRLPRRQAEPGAGAVGFVELELVSTRGDGDGLERSTRPGVVLGLRLGGKQGHQDRHGSHGGSANEFHGGVKREAGNASPWDRAATAVVRRTAVHRRTAKAIPAQSGDPTNPCSGRCAAAGAITRLWRSGSGKRGRAAGRQRSTGDARNMCLDHRQQCMRQRLRHVAARLRCG
ncbi:MAG: hypothetical protein GAK38_01011 [Xylophilus sp.]|nr:MAG: hypothetical protein GAK38_01011 [Xylophilus sp.]